MINLDQIGASMAGQVSLIIGLKIWVPIDASFSFGESSYNFLLKSMGDIEVESPKKSHPANSTSEWAISNKRVDQINKYQGPH